MSVFYDVKDGDVTSDLKEAFLEYVYEKPYIYHKIYRDDDGPIHILSLYTKNICVSYIDIKCNKTNDHRRGELVNTNDGLANTIISHYIRVIDLLNALCKDVSMESWKRKGISSSSYEYIIRDFDTYGDETVTNVMDDFLMRETIRYMKEVYHLRQLIIQYREFPCDDLHTVKSLVEELHRYRDSIGNTKNFISNKLKSICNEHVWRSLPRECRHPYELYLLSKSIKEKPWSHRYYRFKWLLSNIMRGDFYNMFSYTYYL